MLNLFPYRYAYRGIWARYTRICTIGFEFEESNWFATRCQRRRRRRSRCSELTLSGVGDEEKRVGGVGGFIYGSGARLEPWNQSMEYLTFTELRKQLYGDGATRAGVEKRGAVGVPLLFGPWVWHCRYRGPPATLPLPINEQKIK